MISGVPEEGQLLSVSAGAWSGTQASRYLYAWERCAGKRCSEIAGANVSSYRVAGADVGDTLRAVVTDQNLAGSKSATSLSTATVTYGPPVAIGFPAIAGKLREGGRLEAVTGRWVGAPPIEYGYSWETCGPSGCAHTSGWSYTLGTGTAGDTVKLVVTAHNGLGSASASLRRLAEGARRKRTLRRRLGRKRSAASSAPSTGAAGRKAPCPPRARATSRRSPPAGASRSSCTTTAPSPPPARATTARSATAGAKPAGNRARAT